MTIQPLSDQRDHYLDIVSPTISVYLVHLSSYIKWPDLLTFGKGNSKLNRRAAQRGNPGREMAHFYSARSCPVGNVGRRHLPVLAATGKLPPMALRNINT